MEPEWLDKAKRLRAKNESYAKIAQAVGFSATTVARKLDPSYDEAQRLSARRSYRLHLEKHRAKANRKSPCPSCGQPMCWRAEMCLSCRHKVRQESYREIAGMWNAGEDSISIAYALSMAPGSVQTIISRLRRRGWDLEYRRPEAIENFGRKSDGV